MADAGDELAQRFAAIVGFGEDRPKCPVHRVTLSSVFGCTLCDETDDSNVSTSATSDEQESYFKVWEHQVLEEYDLAVEHEQCGGRGDACLGCSDCNGKRERDEQIRRGTR